MVRADLEKTVTAPSTQSPSNNPLDIVEGYIVDSSAQVRKNAASALTILAATDARALDVLVHMLLIEKDRSVQAHLESLILKLPSELSGAFLERLIASEAHGESIWLARLRMKGFGAGQEKTIEALIHLAIYGSAPTRLRITETLATLAGDEQKTAARVLLTFLKTEEHRVARETYKTLGTLRLRGSLLGYPSFLHKHGGESRASRLGTIRERLRRVWSKHGPGCIVDEPDLVARRRASFGFIWMVVGWGALGAVAMAIHLSTGSPSPPPSFYAPFVLGVAVIAGLLGFAATRGATPIGRHYSRLAAGIREAMGAALRALLPAVLVLGTVLAIVSFDPGPRNWIRILVESSLGMCLFIAAIRAGTIVAFGVMPQGRTDADEPGPGSKPPARAGEAAPRTPGPASRRPDRRSAFASSRWNFITEIVVGTAAGLVTASAFLAIARLQRAGVSLAMARVSEGLWIALLPTAAGIASAFAWIDTPGPAADDARTIDETGPKIVKYGVPVHPGRERQLYRVARATSIVLALVLLTGLGIVARRTLRATGATEQAHLAPSGETLTLPPLRIGSLPVESSFAVGFPQRVLLTIPEQPEPPATEDVPDYVIELFEWTPRGVRQGLPDCSTRTGKRTIQRADDPPRIERVLGWGCYTVSVTSTAGEAQTLGRAFNSVLDSRVPFSGDRLTSIASLATTLNVSREQGRVFSDEPATGAGVWLLSQTKKPRIDISAATAVQLFVSALPDSNTNGDAETPTLSRTVSAAPASQYPFAVEVLKDGAVVEDDALRARITLQPGSYTLELKSPEGKPLMTSGIALNMRAALQPPRVNPSKLKPLVDGAAARRAETASGYWMIGSPLPVAYHFRVNYAQDVDLNLLPVENSDPLGILPPRPIPWLLELRSGNRTGHQEELIGLGPLVTSITGPSGRRRVTLKPGDYFLLALTRTQRSRAASTLNTGVIAPANVAQEFAVVELTLNAPKTADAAAVVR